MAKVTPSQPSPSEFRVRFVTSSLLRAASGSVTAFLYWQFDDFSFPGERWSDFAPVVLSWWIEALQDMHGSALLRFMDGPYFIQIRERRAKSALVECHEDRKEKGLVASYRVPMALIRNEIESAGQAAAVALQERNWHSKDIDHLLCLLGKLKNC
jgi:hypothetical protein